MNTILLIRHGQSAANVGLPTLDPESIPLTDKGQLQAENAAKELRSAVDLIIVSPYLRAQQTAEPLIKRFPNALVEIWPEVREFTYLSPASCAGTTVLDRKERVDAYWDAADPDYVDGEGAESFRQFMQRADRVLKKLSELQYKNAAVVSHEQFMRALLMEKLDPVFRNTAFAEKMRMFRNGIRIANAEIIRLEETGLH